MKDEKWFETRKRGQEHTKFDEFGAASLDKLAARVHRTRNLGCLATFRKLERGGRGRSGCVNSLVESANVGVRVGRRGDLDFRGKLVEIKFLGICTVWYKMFDLAMKSDSEMKREKLMTCDTESGERKKCTQN